MNLLSASRYLPTSNAAHASRAWALAGIALLAVASHVAAPLPGTWVPATLQPQAVLMVAALWPRACALPTVLAWLGMGFAGLPMFALGFGGTWLSSMPTAGYLLAYVPVSVLLASVRPRAPLAALMMWLLGSALVLLGGSAWLAAFVGPTLAVKMGISPFLIGDLVKTLLAFAVVWPWARQSCAGR